ncbi:kinase-like domain-containing protein [Rhizophagus diaphanus]|nr:kinase-like domain-containing protein [Rhizophagus diaphanus] [Rhizophagus sp. MUCL 43196]
MELVNTYNESSFDPTPGLKSSPILIKFISFNEDDDYISNYGLYKYDFTKYDKVISSEKDCKLCGKSLYQGTDEVIKKQFKLCSDCYLISSECIESTLVKKKLSIIYLPWWHDNYKYNICRSKLTFTSDCQRPYDDIIDPIFKKNSSINTIGWIPYSQFTDVNEITKGRYGIIYKATWLSKFETVILKRFENSKNDGKYILNELKLIQHCFLSYIVMKYASEGDLHKYLQKNFASIIWIKQKPLILWQISEGGNILFDSDIFNGNYKWKIGDLGLSQAEADIYSFGMIMWGLTSGCKPFHNVKHDHNLIYKILDGERPKITEDTPECYANLMKSCWDPNPKKRPTIKEIRLTFDRWVFRGKNKAEFIQAEIIDALLNYSNSLNENNNEVNNNISNDGDKAHEIIIPTRPILTIEKEANY